MPREKTATFEDLYGQLEQSVEKLEQGGLSLEAAIALYEEGMRLARQCQERLDEAEQKITKLKESFASVTRAGVSDGATKDTTYDIGAEDGELGQKPFG